MNNTKWICGTVAFCWFMTCFTVGWFGHWDWDIRSREETFKRAKFFASPPPPPEQSGSIRIEIEPCPFDDCPTGTIPDAKPDAPKLFGDPEKEKEHFHKWLEDQEHKKPKQPSPTFEWQHDFPKA